MSKWVNDYIQRVNETTVERLIPIEVLTKVFHTSKRDPKEHEIIRNGMIGRYLRTVATHATRYSEATKVPLEDLLSEGNFLLAEYFSGPNALHQNAPLGTYINGTVRNRLIRYTLGTISENLDKEPLTDASSISEYERQEDWDTIHSNFKEFDRTIREKLTDLQYKIFTSHHPMYGVGMTYHRMNKHLNLGLTIEAVRLRYTKARREAEKITGIDLSRKRYEDFKFEKSAYSDSTVEHLNQRLIEKQGTDLDCIINGLNLNSQELYWFIQKTCGTSMTPNQRQDLIEQYKDSESDLSRTQRDRKAELGTLRDKINSFLGMEPMEFMVYTHTLEDDFVKYIKSQFPSVEEDRIKRIITLKQDEKPEEQDFPTERAELSEIELLDRVMNLILEDEHRIYLSNAHSKLSERLKHAYIPIYIDNPDGCMGLLETKLSEFSGTSVYGSFKEVHDFFVDSSQLNIERLRTSLDDFQKIDVITLAEKKRHILASETGVGKTLEIIATAEYADVSKALILTNKSSTIATWHNEIRKHVGDEAVVITGDQQDKESLLERAKNSKWIVMTYEIYQRMSDQIKRLEPNMVVIDEADIMNNSSSLRTKSILETNAEYKYVVSGWIFKNKRSELWPILHWLYPSEFAFRERFAQEFCRNDWGRLKLKYELSHRLIYRPKNLVLPHLGDPKTHIMGVRMNPDEKWEYRQAENEFIEWHKNNNKTELPTILAMSKLHALRKLALKPKFERLYSVLEKRHENPNQSVVVCSYIDEAQKIAVDLSDKGMKVGYFDGQTSAEGRRELTDEFNDRNSEYEVLVMSEAGGKSITLTAPNHIYLFNPVWTYSLKKQIIDRLHRRGQERIVHAYELITRNTLEEKMVAKTEEKKREYEKTVMDAHGYTSWFEENQDNIINSVVQDLVNKNN